MFMRDMASKWNWKKATCLHTPILSSLKASGVRMDSFDHKMSKSDPNGALLLHDTLQIVQKKMKKAYLDPADEHSPVYELAEHVVLPEFGSITVTPNPKFGEASTWDDLEQFKQAVKDGTLHPFDAKMGVAEGVANGLVSIAKHFEEHPETYETMLNITS